MMKNCKETLLGGKKLVSLWLCSLALAACTDTLDEAAVPKPLSVAVNARDITARAPIHGTALPDASNIGISLVAEDGTPYDGVAYDNLKYTAAGTAPDQTWSTPNIPTLSSTPAKLVAYYPWAENTDYSAVPVETDTQTDYMYSQWLTGLSNANPNANIVMKHALTAVRVALVKGDFTADVDVSSVSVKSPAFATAGAMDATTGALSGLTGIGDAVTVTVDFPLTAQATNVEVMAVPDVSVSSGVTTVTTQIGDRKYSVNINFTESYKQGYIYTYTLTLNNTGMEVTSVAVTPWQEGTTGSGNLEVLPVYKQNDYVVKISSVEENYSFIHNPIEFTGVIDWGDGTTTAYDTPTSWPTHIYTTAGEYTVTAMGAATALNNYDYEETAFTELVYIGEGFGISSMEYAFAASDLKKIHPGALDGCTKVTTFARAFYDCLNLNHIPNKLFDYCLKTVSFEATFSNCITLIAIPQKLFDKCPEVTTFYGTFSGCENITEIPAGLFDNNPEVTEFSYIFENLNIEIIPDGLFDNNTKVKNFTAAFDDNDNLKNIPTGLFDNCPLVTSFGAAFSGCTALTSIPPGLFDNCTEVTLFNSTFAKSGITEIPQGLFDYNTKVTSFFLTFGDCNELKNIPEGLFDNCSLIKVFQNTFMNCKALTNIPTGLFDYNVDANFNGTFNGCTNLTGESPYTIINIDGEDKKIHLYERSLYPEFFTAPTSYKQCFKNCTGLTDYANIPAEWK